MQELSRHNGGLQAMGTCSWSWIFLAVFVVLAHSSQILLTLVGGIGSFFIACWVALVFNAPDRCDDLPRMLVCLFVLRIQCIPVFGLVHLLSAWLLEVVLGVQSSKYHTCTWQHGTMSLMVGPCAKFCIGQAYLLQCPVILLQEGNILIRLGLHHVVRKLLRYMWELCPMRGSGWSSFSLKNCPTAPVPMYFLISSGILSYFILPNFAQCLWGHRVIVVLKFLLICRLIFSGGRIFLLCWYGWENCVGPGSFGQFISPSARYYFFCWRRLVQESGNFFFL